MNRMMMQQLQLVHDEEVEDNIDYGRVDGGSSTMTTSAITTKNVASISNINDIKEACCSSNQHSKKPYSPTCRSPTEIISLFSLISDDDAMGIRFLIASTSTSSCTKNNSNEEEQDENIDDIQTIPIDIMNCVLNNFGYTPIIFAVLFGHIDTARCLLKEYGADVNVAAYNGQTALHYAVQCPLIIESIELIQLLLRHSKSNHHRHYLINRQDYNGNTPLHYASSEKVVRLLLRYGANVQIRNNYGEIPLHRAVKYTTYEVVKELLYYPSRTSRRPMSNDNNWVENDNHDDDDQKIVVNNNNNCYDYNRIHFMKSNNGLTPCYTIIHCQSVLDTLGLLDSLRVRLFHLFNKYEQEQQQIKRYIIYSYLLSCPKLNIFII